MKTKISLSDCPQDLQTQVEDYIEKNQPSKIISITLSKLYLKKNVDDFFYTVIIERLSMYIIFEQNIYSAFSEPVRKVDQRIISASEIMDILRNSQWFLSQNVRDAINREGTHNA